MNARSQQRHPDRTEQAKVATQSTVWRVTAGEFPSNSYICQTVSGECFLVDPGLDPDPIERKLAELELELKHILCTHGHFDHLGSAAFFQKKYGAAVHLHATDVKTAKSSNFLMMAFKIPGRVELPQLTLMEGAEAVLDLDGVELTCIHTPGHTPGSSVICFGGSFFTGDTLYAGGVGLSNMPGENPEQLRRSLRALWTRLPSNGQVYPGHDNNATFGEIKARNKALRCFLGMDERDVGDALHRS